MISRYCCGMLLGLSLALCAQLAAEEKPIRAAETALPSVEQIGQLIQRLGDDDYRGREKATEVLDMLGEEIHPQLRQSLLANKKAEVELRLRKLLGGADDRRLIAPALCVSNYCIAVCDGNEEAARKCLSRDCLERLYSTGMFPAPPVAGAHTFQINTVEHKIVNDTTIIGSTWFYQYDGKPKRSSIGFFLTREVDGWKVSLIEDPAFLKSSTSVFR